MRPEQVVTLAPEAPAKAIGRVPKLGTLQVGAPADLSMIEIVEGAIDFVDTRQNTRKGQRWIKPVQTVKAGPPLRRPYPTPLGRPEPPFTVFIAPPRQRPLFGLCPPPARRRGRLGL